MPSEGTQPENLRARSGFGSTVFMTVAIVGMALWCGMLTILVSMGGTPARFVEGMTYQLDHHGVTKQVSHGVWVWANIVQITAFVGGAAVVLSLMTYLLIPADHPIKTPKTTIGKANAIALCCVICVLAILILLTNRNHCICWGV